MRRVFGRRAFLMQSGASLASLAVALPILEVSAKPLAQPIYLLEACGGCQACRACRQHAANKLFATHTAADERRAHPNCKCQVVTSTLDYQTWVGLFGSPRHIARDHVDRRWAWVQAVLND